MSNKNVIKLRKGKRFGKLVILKEDEPFRLPSGQTNRAYLCMCDCGGQRKARVSALVRGRVHSCAGCSDRRHGMVNSGLYNSWRAMKSRCREKYFQSKYYAGKGVTYSKDWEDFRKFKDWAVVNGYSDGLVIDRIDNDKGYCPENCRWVTVKQNTANRDITIMVNYHGITQPLTLLLEKKGLEKNEAAIRGRIKRGWTIDNAFDTPIRKGNYARGKR